MNKNSHILWGTIILFATVPIIYAIGQFRDEAFLDSAMGNWLATMIGVFVGMLGALEVNRIQQEKTLAVEEKRANQEKLDKKKRILSLIKDELEYNKKDLLVVLERQNENSSVKTIFGLKDIFWKSLSDSGELQWVDDLELLAVISDAYYCIRNIIILEDKFYDPNFKMAVSIKDRDTFAGERIVKRVKEMRPDALQRVELALKKIGEHLQG